ncbi:hypothetical protein P3S67_032520 [Capsicum chacoense]
MALSIYFMAFLVLAMTLFVAYGCKSEHLQNNKQNFPGLCWLDSSCRKVCIERINLKMVIVANSKDCLCTKLCAFDNIPNDAGTILVQDVKTLEAELLEEEIFRA